ncbi:serine/threonine-protein kinase [Pyxidicoccus sp. MSG2]|uniref:serine/threonine-protein kinase n=1 Tax=Pyxidicoccus sp. MSG2 TaxID=2996790 RepID=UPI00226EDD7A|nr:serine/threonine-protein kinase [Pyxidicoccus sp. MSG2]MCY1020116.1 protein kinase [Pyxidicoccus sp. MSG2]
MFQSKPSRPPAWCVLLLLVLAAGCDSASGERPATAATAGTVRFYRELTLDEVGGNVPAMHVDPGGGLWVAVSGDATTAGRSRLYHRPPGGSWRTAYEGPFATELSLSSWRAGEVYFGFNHTLNGFEPNLLRVTAGGSESLPTPRERLDDSEYLQVGSYALLPDGDGWACGQRARLWRFRNGAWVPQPSFAEWTPEAGANTYFCGQVRFDTRGQGWVVEYGGGRLWRGTGGRWELLPPLDGNQALYFHASGLASREGRLYRFEEDRWQPIQGPFVLGDIVLDEDGRWGASRGTVFRIERERWVPVASGQRFESRAIAESDGSVWVLAHDGVYRSTVRQVPTFAETPPGTLPRGLLHLEAADFDGDGDEDLLALTPEGGEGTGLASMVAFRNGGDGRFVPLDSELPRAVQLWNGRFALGDIDGDGDLDLVAATRAGTVEVWRFSAGRFERTRVLPLNTLSVALVDMEGDGDLDLHVAQERYSFYVNDGAGQFTLGPEAPTPPGTDHVLWDDADGDGDADGFALRWRDPPLLMRQDAPGRFQVLPLPLVAEGGAWTDLDRDGRPEASAQRLHNPERAFPFVTCAPTASGGCEPWPHPAAPAGLVVDLDVDGHPDVIQAELRVGARMTQGGEVYLGGEQGFERITDITGPLSQPAVFDANGDGAPDVYTPERGLLLATANAGRAVRVDVSASRSDSRAEGAWVLLRAEPDGPPVATARARGGRALVGLPDPSARYTLEVRFPTGEQRTFTGVEAGSTVRVRDVEGPARAGRLAVLWVSNSVRLVNVTREGLALLLGLVALGWLGRRLLPGQQRVMLPAFALGFLLLLGPLVRWGAPGVLLLGPGAVLPALGTGLLRAWNQRRRARRYAGPYVLLERLGAGAAATVWRARGPHGVAALKLFDAEAMSYPEVRDRFFREARAGMQMAHPNLVHILEAGTLEDGRGFLAMRLVDGPSLRAHLAARGVLAANEVRTLAHDVASALAALHGAGVVHRDVKPENILLGSQGAVLTDLGLVRSIVFKTVTRHGAAVGTLAYMSPEQCVGRPVDGRSDLWSLGVVLYELLSGHRPFLGTHELELVYRIHNTSPAPLPPSVPEDLRALIDRCLSRDVEERFQRAEELLGALNRKEAA